MEPMNLTETDAVIRKPGAAFVAGAAVGILGGLIGLGGAEFRLPLLMAIFALGPHQAVRINLLVSLITLAVSTAARFGFSGFADLSALIVPIVAMIAGGVTTAWIGARLLAGMTARHLTMTIAVLLIGISALLALEALVPNLAGNGLPPDPTLRAIVGAIAGLGIGAVSSLLGVAGGELIIPTMMFVFGADVRTAGTASLLISLPTVAVGVVRHLRTGAYRSHDTMIMLVAPMGIGSAVGAIAGGALLPYVSSSVLKLILAVLLALSAVKLSRHR